MNVRDFASKKVPALDRSRSFFNGVGSVSDIPMDTLDSPLIPNDVTIDASGMTHTCASYHLKTPTKNTRYYISMGTMLVHTLKNNMFRIRWSASLLTKPAVWGFCSAVIKPVSLSLSSRPL